MVLIYFRVGPDYAHERVCFIAVMRLAKYVISSRKKKITSTHTHIYITTRPSITTAAWIRTIDFSYPCTVLPTVRYDNSENNGTFISFGFCGPTRHGVRRIYRSRARR